MKNMSEFSEALKQEPSLASTAELDEKILGYAEQHKPQASFNLKSSWQGLASACVVVFSVWFVVQQSSELTTGAAMSPPQMSDPEANIVADELAEVSLLKSAPMAIETAVVASERSARKSSTAKEMKLEKRAERTKRVFDNNYSERFEEEIEVELDRIVQLWINDGRPAAATAYDALMAKCRACEWPEQLEDAVLEQRGAQSYKQLQLVLSDPLRRFENTTIDAKNKE